MATPFGRMINSVKRLEKHYDQCIDDAEAQKNTAETYANLWTESKLSLHRANVRIRRLEAEIQALKDEA